MQDAVGHGAGDFGLGPRRVTRTESCGQQGSHGSVHAQGLPQPLIRWNRAEDRVLPRLSGKSVIRFASACHGRKLFGSPLLAIMRWSKPTLSRMTGAPTENTFHCLHCTSVVAPSLRHARSIPP